MSFSRRDALKLLGGLALAGCAAESNEEETGADQGAFRFCGSREGQRSSDAARTSAPPELQRYEKIVVLMMENRSFDHYFGHLSLPTSMGGEGRTDVDGLRGDEVQYLTRPGGGVEAFKPFLATNHKLGDVDHSWDACHKQFNGGRMDGFIQHHFEDLAQSDDRGCGRKCAGLADPMAYFGRNDTPVLHQLLDNYALCDRWFSSVMGPTWPNRCYLHAGTSTGLKKNKRMDTSRHPSANEARTIWHELNDKCISAACYSMDVPWALGGLSLSLSLATKPIHPRPRSNDRNNHTPDVESFEEACEKGTLPAVSVIDPAFIFAPCDDHPPHDIKAGQAFIAMIYKMLTKNEDQWKKTLFIITYDEHGSFYDHVTPPSVPEDENPEFRQLGFRVPSLVIGPYVKKNYVSHVQYDHVSFLSTVTRRFGLNPLNRRVAATNDVRDCIDMNLIETAGAPPSPMRLQSVRLSESLVHESIKDSLGQSELAEVVYGGPATLEQKKRATDQMLMAFDRMGVATIGR